MAFDPFGDHATRGYLRDVAGELDPERVKRFPEKDTERATADGPPAAIFHDGSINFSQKWAIDRKYRTGSR